MPNGFVFCVHLIYVSGKIVPTLDRQFGKGTYSSDSASPK